MKNPFADPIFQKEVRLWLRDRHFGPVLWLVSFIVVQWGASTVFLLHVGETFARLFLFHVVALVTAYVGWTVAHEAALSVAMEVDENTYDTLACSPLTGRRYILGKWIFWVFKSSIRKNVF